MNESAIELNHVYAFKTILNFVTSLKDYFGTKNKPLAMYHRLLSTTKFDEDDLIKERIDPFKIFVHKNRSAILSQDDSLFVTTQILLTDRIHVDIVHFIEKADDDTTPIIWKHLLAISAILDPAANAKEFLTKSNTNEGNFLQSMMSTIEQSFQSQGVDPAGENPMALLQSVLKSDMIGNMMNSMNENVENGNIDIGALMGSMQQMMGSMGAGGEGGPDIMSMIGAMGAAGGDGGPDIMSMINTVTSQMTVPSDPVLQIEDNEN
jgi:hypothetical protein